MKPSEAYKRLKTCINTAHYIGPNLDKIIIDGLAELDKPAPKKIVKQPKPAVPKEK